MHSFPRWWRAIGIAALALHVPTPAGARSDRGPFAAEPAESSAEWAVPVTGLTRDNVEAVVEELNALGELLHLEFPQILPDVPRAQVRFRLPDGGARVYFSEMESTLENAGVAVRYESLEVPPGCEIVLLGEVDEGSVAALRSALTKTKLFESFVLRVDDDAGDVTVVPVVHEALNYPSLAEEIRRETDYVLSDFAWVTPPARKL